ncbi:MAG: DUF4114 domain-containing protein [Bacteroidales bacterium]
MTKKVRLLAGVLMALLFVVVACTKDEQEKPRPDDFTTIEGIIIKNDVVELNRRMSLRDQIVEMLPQYMDETKSGGQTQDYRSNFTFKLKADVDAPVSNGRTLMATHVAIKDNYAFVSYNIRGEDHGGALEIFDVSNLTQPQIISQAIFPKSDINAVDYSNGKVYLVGATGNFEMMQYDDPAFFLVMNLNSNMQITGLDTILDIPSYSANGIYVSSDKIYITSGDNGGLTILDKQDYEIVKSEPIADARSVAANTSYVYVLSGQPGKVSVFNKTTSDFITAYQIGGANTPYSKSEISVDDQYIFAALNEDGIRVLNTDGTIRQHIPKPETPEGALDENHVTNSVSLNSPLLFIGNGESGIAVGELIPELDNQVVMLGEMVFQDMNSSNFVKSRDNVVFVASGLGGLKILAISIDEGVPDDIIPTEPCPTLLASIKDMFPETQNAMINHPYLFQEGVTLNVTTAEETEVYVVFVWEGAGWKNTFGYYAYPADNPPTSVEELQKYVVFPNVSLVGEGGGLEPGDMVQLGTEPFPANTVIGFYLVAQGWANGQMVNGVYTHYTNINFNHNSNQQHLLFIEAGCQDLVLTFEDIRLPGGDKDFNDIILVIKDNPEQLPNTRFNVEGIIQLNGDDE